MYNAGMTQWTVSVPEDVDSLVRSHLDRSESPACSLDDFVQRAVRQAIFWSTLEEVHEHNRGVDPRQIESDINEAVKESRAART
jgi:hypothetical protein